MIIYDIWYGFIKRKFRDKTSLLYRDIDSVVKKFETDDFYKFMIETFIYNYNCDNVFNISVTKSIYLTK